MSILRGPADADHFRTKVGRYNDRWYADPLPACPLGDLTDAVWPSVSTVKKASGSDWMFVGLKRAAAALIEPHPGLTRLDDTYDWLKQINKSGLRDAGARGTNVHHMFERGLRGDKHLTDPMDGDAGAEYETAVRAFLDSHQPELVAAELVCINRSMHAPAVLNGKFTGGYGGTADAIVKIDGKTLLVDWKSRGADSDHGVYPEEAAQLGAYASADYYIAEGNGGPIRMPVPHLDGGIIVSVKPDGCRVYDIDLEAAAAHWQALHSWWVARLTEKRALGKPWAPRVASAPAAAANIPDADIARASYRSLPEVTAYEGGLAANSPNIEPRLDTLIRHAVDVSTLNAIWALHSHEWQPHHTQLAAARKTALIGNP
jgi:hypothetical protein